jgi:MarR-like DNA-binding transcriptional regulator SgrR of sgrS sRNA
MTWVEQVLRNPERSEPDGIDQDLEHRLGRTDECEGRVLRVIVNRAVSPLRIVTVYFDRAMRNKL